MKKWDGKPSSILEAQVCELQGKTVSNVEPSREFAAPVSSGQFLKWRGKVDFTPNPTERNSNQFLQEASGEPYDQD